jgi:NADPH-dependent glutamate synthase beta subunit-like oxidoreductase
LERLLPKYPAVFRDFFWYRQNVPCMEACPVHTDSGRYVQLIAEGKYKEAYLVARSPNPLASICGRICSAPCEDACRRRFIDQPVTIRPLKRFVTEKYGAESTDPDSFQDLLKTDEDLGCHRIWHLSELRNQIFEKKERKVAVVGAGPSGLACAHDLALMGYSVTIFEALDHSGGMLRYGIPEYRLPRGVIEREISHLDKLGVTLHTGIPLTADYNLKSLKGEGFEAIFLSIGAMQGRDLNIPGSDKDGCMKAVDYLLNLNRGYRLDLGQKVVVIGGGLVALDTARTIVRDFYTPMEEIEKTAEAVVGQPALDVARGALRAGASEVHVVSLESFEEMPASQTVSGSEELSQAREEGITFHPSWGPKIVLGDKKVTGIELVACTQVFDENGRFNPQFNSEKTQIIDTDSVIFAIGQQVDLSFVLESDDIELTKAGTIKIDPETLATTTPGIYAGGDAAFGPRIAIEAVANGKTAARSIHDYLTEGQSSKSVQIRINKIPTNDYSMFSNYETLNRQKPPTTETGRRTGIAEVENVYEEEEAVKQAERCLKCHIDTIYDAELCILCGRCSDVCPEKCLKFVPLDEVDMPDEQRKAAFQNYGFKENDGPLTVLLKDDTSCIRCGLCAIRCPTDAMTMEQFNFIESVE